MITTNVTKPTFGPSIMVVYNIFLLSRRINRNKNYIMSNTINIMLIL